MPEEAPVVIAGAGPGGLTAAYQLTKRGLRPLVLEADPVVGGISRTVERDGWRFDLGGHRFFTKVPEVEALWHEILPEGDFLLRPRMSRIFYKGKYYDYPLKAMNAVRNLGCGSRCSAASPTSGPASGHPSTRRTTRIGWWPASAGGSTGPSSRPTPNACGGSRCPKCRRTGPPSASRTWTCARRSSTRSCPSGTRRRSRASSRSSSTRSTGPG